MDFKEFTTRAEQDIRAALEDASPGVGVGMNQVDKLQGESYTATRIVYHNTAAVEIVIGHGDDIEGLIVCICCIVRQADIWDTDGLPRLQIAQASFLIVVDRIA